jgi:hypothetical protein
MLGWLYLIVPGLPLPARLSPFSERPGWFALPACDQEWTSYPQGWPCRGGCLHQGPCNTAACCVAALVVSAEYFSSFCHRSYGKERGCVVCLRSALTLMLWGRCGQVRVLLLAWLLGVRGDWRHRELCSVVYGSRQVGQHPSFLLFISFIFFASDIRSGTCMWIFCGFAARAKHADAGSTASVSLVQQLEGGSYRSLIAATAASVAPAPNGYGR